MSSRRNGELEKVEERQKWVIGRHEMTQQRQMAERHAYFKGHAYISEQTCSGIIISVYSKCSSEWITYDPPPVFLHLFTEWDRLCARYLTYRHAHAHVQVLILSCPLPNNLKARCSHHSGIIFCGQCKTCQGNKKKHFLDFILFTHIDFFPPAFVGTLF